MKHADDAPKLFLIFSYCYCCCCFFLRNLETNALSFCLSDLDSAKMNLRVVKLCREPKAIAITVQVRHMTL